MSKMGVLHSPWKPEDFLFYCCPECDVRSKGKSDFIDHTYSHIFLGYNDNLIQDYSKSTLWKEESSIKSVENEDTASFDNENDLLIQLKTEHNSYEYDDNYDHQLDDNDEDMSTDESIEKSVDKLKNPTSVSKRRNEQKRGHIRPGDLSCWQCQAKPFTYRMLRKHFLEEHGHNQCFKCLKCNTLFTLKSSYWTHMKNIHTDNPTTVICYLCPFTTSNASYLSQHMERVHAVKGEVACPHCSRKFTCNDFLSRHIQNVHTVDKYPCSECTQMFGSRKAMRNHLIDIHDHQCFSCDRCEAKFISKPGLEGHIQDIHEKSYNFKCTKCSAAFANNKNLKRHFQRNHEENKPFACDKCDQKFSIASDLKTHKRARHKE